MQFSLHPSPREGARLGARTGLTCKSMFDCDSAKSPRAFRVYVRSTAISQLNQSLTQKLSARQTTQYVGWDNTPSGGHVIPKRSG